MKKRRSKNRCVWLLLDDTEHLDFHGSFRDEAKRGLPDLAKTLGPVSIVVTESQGSRDEQRRFVVELANNKARNPDDLVCLFPTDSYAVEDLLRIFFPKDTLDRKGLVCVLMHQVLPPKLHKVAKRTGRLFSIGADQFMMGSQQAEQIMTLFGSKTTRERRLLYISGPSYSSATRLRIAGAVETLLSHNIVVDAVNADWRGDGVAEKLEEWQRAGGELRKLDVVAAQNDQIGRAAKQWLRGVGEKKVPVVGMDGTWGVGKKMVKEGTLAATVVQPLGAREALEAYAAIVRHGKRPQVIGVDGRKEDAPLDMRLQPHSFPPLTEL